MPIEIGDKTHDTFEDASQAVQSSKDLPKERADAYVATVDQKQNEVEPNLMTPKQQETEPITNQSPKGEAENEDLNKDAKREEQQGATEQEDEFPEQFNEVPDKPEKIEDEPKEDKIELEGETYKLLKINESVLQGNVIEYDSRFYTPLGLKERARESDIDYNGTVYKVRTNKLIEYNNKIYQKEAVNPHTDAEPPQDQALGGKDNVDDQRPLELPAEEEGGPTVSGPPAGTEPTVIEDELTKTGENIVVKTRKGYKKLQVYEVDTSSNKLENLKNRGLSKDDKKEDKKEDKEAKKKA